MRSSVNKALILVLVIFVAACGSSTDNNAVETTAITGSIFAGPVNGASVTVKNTSGTSVAGPVTTGNDGTYSINIPNSALSSDLIIEASSGTFPDEATGTTGVTAGALSAYVSGGSLSAGSSVNVDPSSTVIQKLVAGGKSLTDAKSAFNTAFGYTPDTSVAPVFASYSTARVFGSYSGTTLQNKKLAGLRIATFSQLVKDLGLTPEKQFELLTALADDLSDGTLDGKKSNASVTTSSGASIPEDIGNKFEKAFINFIASANNKTKLTPDKIGALPFAKTVLTTTYKVAYVEGSMKAMQGKTTFKVSVTNRSDGSVAPGLTLSLTPKMYMATMSHGTPVGNITDNGDGTYTCVVYYLMASGPTMGYWELKVGVNGGTATFYPSVAMSMGDTTRATLRYFGDTYTNMGSASVRPYFIFKDALTAGMGGTYTFKVFIGARETMMNHPALYTGLSMNSGTFTASTVAVAVSTDGGSTWLAMTEGTAGYFSKSGLTGLTNGSPGTILVKLTINGNDYVDTATGTGGNSYASFTVTPSGM